MANDGIGYGLGRAKQSGEILFPTRKDPREMVLSFVEFADRNRDAARIKEILGVDIGETPAWQRIAIAMGLVAKCKDSLKKLGALYDRVQRTVTVLDGGEFVSLPGKDHDGTGFYPCDTPWTKLQYKKDGEWVTGWVDLPSLNEDGTVTVYSAGNPGAPSTRVSNYDIRRA